MQLTAAQVTPTELPAKLLVASHVLVRHDSHVLPLALLYVQWPLRRPSVVPPHLHHPDGRQGGGGLHGPPQAVPDTPRGARTTVWRIQNVLMHIRIRIPLFKLMGIRIQIL